MTLNIPRGSVEYITATVTADVPLTMPVELSLSRGDTHTWLPATWEGAPGETRNVRTLNVVTFDDTYEASAYSVCVRLTDNPEMPVIDAGRLNIT